MNKRYNVYLDAQNNKKFVGYRVRVVDTNFLNCSKSITKYFKSKCEAENYELQVHRLLQFLGDSRD